MDDIHIWQPEDGSDDLKVRAEHARRKLTAVPAVTSDNLPANREAYEQMIGNMRKTAELINQDQEIIDNGFAYPMEWLDAFEHRVFELCERGERPAIGIVGYGSLQSKDSASKTMEVGRTALVQMQGVRRGLYMSGLNRSKKEWNAMGLDVHEEQAVMAVKADKASLCNGVRIPMPDSAKDLAALHTREFAYELLPGPPATEAATGATHELNVLCWPLGRNLMNTLRKEKLNRDIGSARVHQESSAVAVVTQEETARAHQLLSERKTTEYHDLLKAHPAEDGAELTKGMARAYDRRAAGMYDLYQRPLPNMNYVHQCLDIGDAAAENVFLDTTYCYGPEGTEMTLREYLKGQAPGKNPKVRAYGL